jgi:hypothetical protein
VDTHRHNCRQVKDDQVPAAMKDIEIHRLDPGPDWRYELKLTCEAQSLPQARNWIQLHPEGFRTAYPPRLVNNIYLDASDLRLLNANLSGMSNKQKLRIRWYGEEPDEPILELKYKQNWLGGKLRFHLPQPIDLYQPWSEILANVTADIPTSWQHLLGGANQPKLINRYRREYYATFDGALRITLDYGQEVYDQTLSLRPNLHQRLPVENLLVIELKADSAHSDRLEQVCSRFPIRLSRNSKYAESLRSASL